MRYFFILSLLFLLSCNNPPEDLDPPNILWITTEDITTMLGSYGDSVAHTPNLDQLAREGVRFTNAFANAAVCAPARSTLITGVYSTSLGSQHLRSEVKIPDFIVPFPKYLKEVGYYCTNNEKEDYSFTDNTIWHESSGIAHWRNRPEGAPFFSVINFGTTHQSQIFGNDQQFYEKYQHQLSEEEIHDPEDIKLPPYYFDTPQVRKLWARYYDLITIMDKQVGEVLSQLEEDGLTDNTIVFFYSDHGTGMPRAKRALFDSGLKVPLIIKAPPKYQEWLKLQPGTTQDHLVSFVDFAPTLLNMLDIPIPEFMDGSPFLGKNVVYPEYVYGAADRVDEAYELSRTVRTKEFRYIRNYYPHLPLIQSNYYSDQSEIMQELHKILAATNVEDLSPAQLTMWRDTRPPEELYHVDNDPYEINNLADDPEYQDKLVALRKVNRDWILKTHDTGFMPEPYMYQQSDTPKFYELAHQEQKYPLSEILNIADWQLSDNITKQQIIEATKHQQPLIRYWSLIVAAYFPEIQFSLMPEFIQLLNDPDAMVRITAAGLILQNNYDETAASSLIDIMKSDNEKLLLMASRTFELLPDEIRRQMPEVEDIKNNICEATKDQWYGHDLYACWALRAAYGEVSH